MIFGGLVLVSEGWSKIYHANGTLVTNGIYSHIRHPQYLGIFLATSGFLLQWITIPTAIMFPILLVIYYKLAKSEENEMRSQFGDQYARYSASVPMSNNGSNTKRPPEKGENATMQIGRLNRLSLRRRRTLTIG
jgi:protein-S-isoprenylcysteine O-methyltransferase Ste14